MKLLLRLQTAIASLAALTLLSMTAVQAEDGLSADDIVKKHAEKQKLTSEVEFVTIVTIDADGNPTRHSILFLTQKDDAGHHDYLIRVVSPKDYDGVGLLAKQHDGGEVERYMYLPALGKVKQVKGGKGKSPNFLGSNFTYEDLMKETPERYEYERLEDTSLDGIDCYVVRAKIAGLEEDEEPTYIYRDIYFDKEAFNIHKIAFIGPDGKPSKTLRAFEYKSAKVDGPTMRPLRAEMRDLEAGSISVLTVLRSRFNEPIDPKYFTKEDLANWTPDSKKEILNTFKKKAQ